jgi:hypothetical protein
MNVSNAPSSSGSRHVISERIRHSSPRHCRTAVHRGRATHRGEHGDTAVLDLSALVLGEDLVALGELEGVLYPRKTSSSPSQPTQPFLAGGRSHERLDSPSTPRIAGRTRAEGHAMHTKIAQVSLCPRRAFDTAPSGRAADSPGRTARRPRAARTRRSRPSRSTPS